MFILFCLFNFFIILSCLGLIISKNPIHSILFLILIFINITSILLLFQIEFLGILFLIVYLGAIIILFLFIIMFLNIKLINLSENIIKYTPFTVCFLLILFFLFSFLFNFSYNELYYNSFFNNWYLSLYQLYNLESLGNLIYNYYFDYLYLSAILLFLAILGIVCLTLKIELDIASKRQDLFLQIRSNFINIINIINL